MPTVAGEGRDALVGRGSGGFPGVPGLVLFLVVLLFSMTYGFQYRVPGVFVQFYFLSASILFAALVVLLALLIARSGRSGHALREIGYLPSRVGLAIGVSLCAVLSCLVFHGGAAPWERAVAMAGIAAVVLVLAWLGRTRWALWFLSATGLTVFAYLTLVTPLDVRAANMLPIIAASCESLAAGENPFLRTYPGIATAPMYYLPLNVLPYCLPEWSGLDIRWMNIVLMLALFLMLARLFDFRHRPEILGLSFLPVLFSPMSLQMGYYGHVWPYWFGTVVLAVLVWKERLWAAAVVLGLLLLTRQTAVFTAGLLGAGLVAAVGWRNALRYGALVCGLPAAGLLLVFLLTGTAPLAFFTGVSSASDMTHAATTNPTDQIAISGAFVMAGLRAEMLFIQAATAALLCGAFLRAGRHPTPVLIAGVGCAYLVVISLSVFLHRYFYGAGMLLIASGLAMMMHAAWPRGAAR